MKTRVLIGACVLLLGACVARADKTPQKVYTQEIPGTLVKFDMALVAAGEITMPDPAKEGATKKIKVGPFYIAKTETTWDAYDAYRLGALEEVKLVEKDATSTPSNPYGRLTVALAIKATRRSTLPTWARSRIVSGCRRSRVINIGCRPKLNGNSRAGQARRSQTPKSLKKWLSRLPRKPQRSHPRSQMPGIFTICWAMWRSGASI